MSAASRDQMGIQIESPATVYKPLRYPDLGSIREAGQDAWERAFNPITRPRPSAEATTTLYATPSTAIKIELFWWDFGEEVVDVGEDGGERWIEEIMDDGIVVKAGKLDWGLISESRQGQGRVRGGLEVKVDAEAANEGADWVSNLDNRGGNRGIPLVLMRLDL
ncbi:hypothetical protein BT96DRAFT_949565 [Gymnopus androsaceus JB14]|uniref:Uncharacterized protein n=1 Tax=Gymnopus androsaceus JB14 TaxID=1447944 RepID=A0A6A4GJM3_9AGAR|nr:hypothetical protein BT96DRAFT_949565 [Gymnopus androsaceus JB14]